MVRRLALPLLGALFGLLHVFSGGCSSSSAPVGGGACEGFCTRMSRADCRNKPTMDACMVTCTEQRSRCEPEADARLRCATIESSIACDSSSGEPRTVGCGPREAALERCMICDRFCEAWVRCPKGPTREECVASCVDPRCASQHQAFAQCARPFAVECTDTGPVAPADCMSLWSTTWACTRLLGGAQPFRWLPVEPLPADASSGG